MKKAKLLTLLLMFVIVTMICSKTVTAESNEARSQVSIKFLEDDSKKLPQTNSTIEETEAKMTMNQKMFPKTGELVTKTVILSLMGGGLIGAIIVYFYLNRRKKT